MTDALIIGGGIAGLSAAIALGQAGIACEVIEPAPGGIGAAISLSGSQPIAALEELGVLDECLAAGRPMVEMRLRWFDAAGELVHQVGVEGVAERPRGVGIHRPVLLDILRRAAREQGAELRDGPLVQRLVPRHGAVGVEYVGAATPPRSFDLVIGAEGIASATRRAHFAGAPEPAFAGQASLRWMAPGPAIDGPGSFYNSSACLLAGYALPQDLIYAVTTFAAEPGVHLGPVAARDLLAAQLDTFTAPYVRELRARLDDDAEVLYRPFEWLLVDEPWVRGRIALVGDAAHATTAHLGYGGCLALEDAVVLGRRVAEHAGDLDAGLAAYAARRFPRAQTVVNTSVEVSRMEQEGRTPEEIAVVRVPVILGLEAPFDADPAPPPTAVARSTPSPSQGASMSIDGTWQITVATPMGPQSSTLEVSADGAELTGTQSAHDATNTIYEGSVDGAEATWKVDVTVPSR